MRIIEPPPAYTNQQVECLHCLTKFEAQLGDLRCRPEMGDHFEETVAICPTCSRDVYVANVSPYIRKSLPKLKVPGIWFCNNLHLVMLTAFILLVIAVILTANTCKP